MRACDELDGMPNSQVSRFQMMPPARPAATTCSVTVLGVDQAVGDRGRDGQREERPDQVERAGHGDGDPRGSAPVAIEVAIALPVS